MKTCFINEAFEKAIVDYLNNKEQPEGVMYNSFLVVVIRLLINIYGELDIINPYQIKSEKTFDDNLMKYGLNIEELAEFKRLLDGFYRIEKKNISSIKREENIYFIETQKKIIDMFNLKKVNYGITDDERKEFFDLLYTPGTSNVLRLSYNFLNASNIYEIAEYFKNAMLKEVKKEEKEKDLLPIETYKLFGINLPKLIKMNNEEITKLNNNIYKSFDISENAINKDYLLEKSIKEYKMKNSPITTGNGYVDILLIMSVIVTTIMIVVIFGALVI